MTDAALTQISCTWCFQNSYIALMRKKLDEFDALLFLWFLNPPFPSGYTPGTWENVSKSGQLDVAKTAKQVSSESVVDREKMPHINRN